VLRRREVELFRFPLVRSDGHNQHFLGDEAQLRQRAHCRPSRAEVAQRRIHHDGVTLVDLGHV
jgi:hypothetical protein